MGDLRKFTAGDFIVRFKRQEKAINSIMHRFKVEPEENNFSLKFIHSSISKKSSSNRCILPTLTRTSRSYSQFRQLIEKVNIKK